MEAVDRVATNKHYYDAILMDYKMPRLDSFIVGVSGNVLPDDVAIFRNHAANAVLPKPVQFPDLKSLLSKYAFPDRGNEVEAD